MTTRTRTSNVQSSSSIIRAQVVTCPICCDSFPCHRSASLPLRPCCGQVTCQSCLHSHIQSILTEGLAGGGGRTTLSCPLGCGAEITDAEVRRIIRAVNWSFRHHLLGELLFRLLGFLGLFGDDAHNKPQIRTQNAIYYSAWVLFTKSAAEWAELGAYERWSLNVALGPNRSDRDKESEEVIRCPAPDCNYAWVANATYRKKKIANERKYDSSTSSSGRKSSSMVRSATTWLFYRPPKQECVPYDWVDGQYIDPFNFTSDQHNSISESGKIDGRRVVCPACRSSYCGLCRRPWVTYRAGRANSSKRESHKNQLCSSFARRTGTDADDYAYAANAADARVCPGCSLRTSRIEGCNHMTCPCGFEWCYVCECRWGVHHYGCSESNREENEGGISRGCVIS